MANEDKGWQLQPLTFHSEAPLFGPLITTLRNGWHSIAGKWALQHIIDQQNGFNLISSQQLLALETEQDELRHEVAHLTAQLQSVQRQLQDLQARVTPDLE